MIDSHYRNAYQKIFIEPLLRVKGVDKISPNALTELACALGVITCPLIAFGYPFTATVFLLFSGFLDTLDGSIARYRNLTSVQGTVMDIISDRLVELSVILGLFFISPDTRSFLCMLMLGSTYICVTSFLVVGIFTKNNSKKSFFYSPGLIERTEAFILFFLLILIPSQFFLLSSLFIVGVFLTAFIRIWQFFFRKTENSSLEQL